MGKNEWADVVRVVELAMITAIAASMGEAPAKIDLGELPCLPVDIAVDHKAANQSAAMDLLRTMQNLVAVTKEPLHATQEQMAMQANKYCHDSVFAVGDRVL